MFKDFNKYYFITIGYICVIMAVQQYNKTVPWQFVTLVIVATIAGVVELQNMWREFFKSNYEEVRHFKCLGNTFYFGLPEAFKTWRTQWNDDNEFITGVTIKHPNGVMYVALAPLRHHHIVRAMDQIGRAGIKNTREGGFITNLGRCVSRQEGMYIARHANQLLPVEGNRRQPTHLLYSEDVWD